MTMEDYRLLNIMLGIDCQNDHFVLKNYEKSVDGKEIYLEALVGNSCYVIAVGVKMSWSNDKPYELHNTYIKISNYDADFQVEVPDQNNVSARFKGSEATDMFEGLTNFLRFANLVGKKYFSKSR